jgi:hypothetical protein
MRIQTAFEKAGVLFIGDDEIAGIDVRLARRREDDECRPIVDGQAPPRLNRAVDSSDSDQQREGGDGRANRSCYSE